MNTVHTARTAIEGINKLEIALLNSYTDWLAIPHWDTEPKALAWERVNSDYRALCSFVAANDWERPPRPPMPSNEQLKMEWLDAIQLWHEEVIGRLIGRIAKTEEPEQAPEQVSPTFRAITMMQQHAKRTGKLLTMRELRLMVPDAKRSTLYDDPVFKASRNAIRETLASPLPKGHKTKEGKIEAYSEDEEPNSDE
jgi:hypothetical protein